MSISISGPRCEVVEVGTWNVTFFVGEVGTWNVAFFVGEVLDLQIG